MTSCLRCGRTLTNGLSISRNYGPICYVKRGYSIAGYSSYFSEAEIIISNGTAVLPFKQSYEKLPEGRKPRKESFVLQVGKSAAEGAVAKAIVKFATIAFPHAAPLIALGYAAYTYGPALIKLLDTVYQLRENKVSLQQVADTVSSGVEAASSNEVEDQVKQEFSEYSSKQSYPFIRNAMTALDALVSPAIAKILGEMGGKATTMAINYFNNTG